jgi:hypothetical protein
MSLTGRLYDATRAFFRALAFQADPVMAAEDPNAGWGDVANRRARYAIYWGLYRNNVYDCIENYRGGNRLYKWTRGIYSPASRLINFHRSHLLGGRLDPDAGDGSDIASALPIVGPKVTDGMRAAIAKLWWDSDWEVNKDVLGAWGTTFGDAFINVCADEPRERMLMEVLHPGTIVWMRKDRGAVVAYRREEMRADPEDRGPLAGPTAASVSRRVRYTELVEMDEGTGKVHYRTYKDDQLYPWNGVKAEWDAPFVGFIPLYHVAHIDGGLGWGESELEVGRAKFDGVNDLGSKLHDYVRRVLEGTWLIEGARKPKAEDVQLARESPDEMSIIWTTSTNVRPHSLIPPLVIADCTAEIRQLLDAIEDDYPELRFERLRTGGDISGEALREARKPAAARIEGRRVGYESAIVAAQMAAMAIGGHLGMPGYEGFGLSTYDASAPNHRIAHRPVFSVEPIDTAGEDLAFGQATQAWVASGVPLAKALEKAGWSPEDIADVEKLKAQADAAAVEQQRQMIAAEQMGGLQ